MPRKDTTYKSIASIITEKNTQGKNPNAIDLQCPEHKPLRPTMLISTCKHIWEIFLFL
jgi:hypothetical protein